MSKPVVAVVVCTLLALVFSWLHLPIRFFFRSDPQHPLFESERTRAGVELARTPPAADRAEAFNAAYSGRWATLDPHWPPVYCWAWEMNPTQRGTIEGEYRVSWSILLATQALILLLGGGLLTFVVRRDRRRKAAA